MEIQWQCISSAKALLEYPGAGRDHTVAEWRWRGKDSCRHLRGRNPQGGLGSDFHEPKGMTVSGEKPSPEAWATVSFPGFVSRKRTPAIKRKTHGHKTGLHFHSLDKKIWSGARNEEWKRRRRVETAGGGGASVNWDLHGGKDAGDERKNRLGCSSETVFFFFQQSNICNYF